MRVQQIRNILQLVQQRHQTLQDNLGLAELKTTDRTTADFISDLRRHEQHWGSVIRTYLQQGNAGILNTWIQLTPDLDLPDHAYSDAASADHDCEAVALAVCEFHKRMERLYGSLTAAVSVPSVRDFLQRLLRLEQTIVTERAWAARIV